MLTMYMVVVAAAAAVAMATEEDEYYEVDDLEEMHTAIVNNDHDQVQCNFRFCSNDLVFRIARSLKPGIAIVGEG